MASAGHSEVEEPSARASILNERRELWELGGDTLRQNAHSAHCGRF